MHDRVWRPSSAWPQGNTCRSVGGCALPQKAKTPSRRKRPGNRSRSGAVVLELILVLPILLIFLLAIIEFGLILTNLKQVALASRVGAEQAAQTAGISTVNNDPAPPDVITAIEQQLLSSNIDWCRITVEHNVGGSPVTLTSGTCTSGTPTNPFPASGEYVRVTVTVELLELTPNLLDTFGFDISGQHVEHSTTYRYEL